MSLRAARCFLYVTIIEGANIIMANTKYPDVQAILDALLSGELSRAQAQRSKNVAKSLGHTERYERYRKAVALYDQIQSIKKIK